MMGGLSFMVNEKMCVGVLKDTLMTRIDPEHYESALTKTGVRKMDFTGRPMKGFLFIDPEGISEDSQLEYWIKRCLDYNPKARSSRSKSKK